MSAGRHGGRATENAGTRDLTYDAKKPERPNVNRVKSWVGLRYGVWQGLQVGKVYVMDGRRGKILKKSDASRGSGGLPLAFVEWRD
jgi:hypothetical protein